MESNATSVMPPTCEGLVLFRFNPLNVETIVMYLVTLKLPVVTVIIYIPGLAQTVGPVGLWAYHFLVGCIKKN